MYVVTFYSFKGGVGRTMALVNAAVELTLRGKKVLVVDFDLEAPGIQTYEPFTTSGADRGVVDYVTDYVREGRAPDAHNYITESKIDDKSIWLMPAGRQDANYAYKLNCIDWLALYREKNGYLMFEDLKQQWQLEFNFDYVLVDSRTGHTDVGGICTRQLPNSNVLMFFPNEQNISGLKEVVRTIRSELDPSREAAIYTHFCPSNVPDLDDEELILQRHFDSATQKLGYDEPASIIHHYNSLALLDQKVFVRDRKRTRLADEYRKLVDAIVSENLEDRSGVLSKLDRIRAAIRADKAGASSAATEKYLDTVFRLHGNDGEVAWSLAASYYGLGNVKGELASLNAAIQQRVSEMRARNRRASLLGVKQIDLAKEDLRIVISSPESSVPEVVSAIDRLREMDPSWLSVVSASSKIRQLNVSDLGRVANALLVDRAGAQLTAELFLNKLDRHDASEVPNPLLLSLIAVGSYQKVLELLGHDREAILRSEEILPVFNFACAEWGQQGVPPLDIFMRVVELGARASYTPKAQPNFWQCLSLASYVSGAKSDAIAQLEVTRGAMQSTPPTEIFSCWRYLFVDRNEFVSDLEKMGSQMAQGEKLVPEFLQQLSFLPEQ